MLVVVISERLERVAKLNTLAMTHSHSKVLLMGGVVPVKRLWALRAVSCFEEETLMKQVKFIHLLRENVLDIRVCSVLESKTDLIERVLKLLRCLVCLNSILIRVEVS